MDALIDFRAAFLDAEGELIRITPILAETLTIATSRAGEIADEIDAADFYITSKPAYPRASPLSQH